MCLFSRCLFQVCRSRRGKASRCTSRAAPSAGPSAGPQGSERLVDSGWQPGAAARVVLWSEQLDGTGRVGLMWRKGIQDAPPRHATPLSATLRHATPVGGPCTFPIYLSEGGAGPFVAVSLGSDIPFWATLTEHGAVRYSIGRPRHASGWMADTRHKALVQVSLEEKVVVPVKACSAMLVSHIWKPSY